MLSQFCNQIGGIWPAEASQQDRRDPEVFAGFDSMNVAIA